MPELQPGDVFVEHRIDAVAGRGGMGVVYRATQLELGRVVALKLISPALAAEEEFRRRFVAETKAASMIEHPHVIPVYYAGERDDVLFIAMRFVDGPDLRELVQAQGRLAPDRAARIVAQISSALDAAHGLGLVHRDVKPANILLDKGDHAYLTDFGLTKHAASTTGGLSRAGGWVGTLGYVAPEQIRGERVDARTDVYALGCALVFALTGAAPFVRDSDEATLWAHLSAPPPTDAVPREFAGIVERALAKDPSDRYGSAGALGDAALLAAGTRAAMPSGRNVEHDATAAFRPTKPAVITPPRMPSAAVAETLLAAQADPGGERPRRAVGLAAGVFGIVAVVAIAIYLLLGRGGEMPSTLDAPARADAPGPHLERPNAIAITPGLVWALSSLDGEMLVIDPRTSKIVDRVTIASGGSSIAPGFGSVWVVSTKSNRLLRIDTRSRRILFERSPKIASRRRAIAVATGARAVWVGLRNRSLRSQEPELVVRVNPVTLEQQPYAIRRGVQDLAFARGALWISNRFSSTVTRIRASDDRRAVIRVGSDPRGIAAGAGAIWVAAFQQGAITRIDPQTLSTSTVALSAVPDRVAVGGGSVWATSSAGGQLLRIDPRRRRLVERIDTGPRPFALDVDRGAVWLTLLDGNAVQRVRFFR